MGSASAQSWNFGGNGGAGASAGGGAISFATVTITSSLVVLSSGQVNGISLTCQGLPSGGMQNPTGGCLNITMPLGSAGENAVFVSSRPSAQIGQSMLLFLQQSLNWNDPLLRIIDNNAGNSSPQIRIDAYAPNFEVVALSTDNAHGKGKFEIFGIAFGGVLFQIGNPRCYDNTGFENMLYFSPPSVPTRYGMWGQVQDAQGCDAGIISSSDTFNYGAFTLNNHQTWITGPMNTTASFGFAWPSTVGSQGEIIFHNGTRSAGQNSTRQWEWTNLDFTYSATTGVTISTQTSRVVTISSMIFVGAGLSTAPSAGAGAATTATCYGGSYATSGGCECTGAVGITSVLSRFNTTTPGAIPTGWTCQDAGGTGAACIALANCTRIQ